LRIRSVAVVAGLLLFLARAAAAQQTFTSLAGPWWFSLGGKDSGALLVEFSEPNGPAFTVTDVELSEHPSFGFSRALGDFFQIAADQPLALDAKGNVVGALVLNASGGAVGTLTLVKGKPNKKFTKLKLSGTIDVGGGPLVVKLTGVRPADFPVLTGHTIVASLSGKGAKSKTMDLGVASDVVLGLPAYTFSGHGQLLLDKVPVPNTLLEGQVMLDPKFRAHGLLVDSSDFGTGFVKGKLKLKSQASTAPALALTLEADRKLSLKASLTEPIEPVLAVTPISWDFGALHLDQTVVQLFAVTNVGVGVLSGTASFSSDTDDFELIGSPTYTALAPGDPAVMIAVAFNPQTEGSKTATVHFGLDTLFGAKNVAVRGVGGIPIITVDPEPVAFLDTVANGSRTVTVTVTNDGDAVLAGRARLSGSNAFALLQPPNTIPVAQISYSLAPGESKVFDVRFAPTVQGDFLGTLVLTGGDGANVAVMGSGI
jgi:hypothetical protein